LILALFNHIFLHYQGAKTRLDMESNGKIVIYGAVVLVLTALFSCGPKPSAKQDKYLTYYAEAHAFMEQNQPAKAIPLYKKAIAKKIDFAQAYHELAVCYQQIGDDSLAIDNYEGSIVYNPKDVDAYQSIGNMFFVKRQYDEAMSWYDKATEVDFLYPRSYNNMATIWFMRGDSAQAKKYWNQAISIDATYPRAYYGLGLVALAENDTTEAESKMLDAVKIGSMPEAIYTLGTIYYDKHNYEQAESWFNRYLEKEPAGQWSDKARDMLVIIGQKKGQVK
jgi:tetratricopeptide (TPR) repeat protein